jgi:hypothetical protein
MIAVADQPAENPFWFWECFLVPMPTGKKATNLRELLQGLREMEESVLQFHLWQSRLATIQPTIEYPNDFALWAAAALHDERLAEKLSSIDPFAYENLGQIREALVDLLEEYLWDISHNPAVEPGFEFHFCEAAAAHMRSGMVARTLNEFSAGLREVGLDSVYFHVIEAQWRLGVRKLDDFSHWLDHNFTLPELVSAIRDIDIYFYTLEEVRETILALIEQHAGESRGESE